MSKIVYNDSFIDIKVNYYVSKGNYVVDSLRREFFFCSNMWLYIKHRYEYKDFIGRDMNQIISL